MTSGAGLSTDGTPGILTTPTRRSRESTGASPNAKRAVSRVVVQRAIDVPDVPHHNLVQEVHNLYTQAAQDAKFFEHTNETIENHADVLEALCQCGKTMI